MRYVIKDSPLHGLGVFAAEDLPSGSTIERCAYIVIDDDDLQEVNRLNDYLFTSPDDPGDYLCVMGAGMLYNPLARNYCMIMAANIGQRGNSPLKWVLEKHLHNII